MTRLAEGSIIQAGVKQIQQNYQLTPNEEKLANNLAESIKKSKKESISAVGGPSKVTQSYNWIPVFVTENGNRNYEVIGSAVVLEACKKAGLTIINCLQIDHSPEAAEQVENLYKALRRDERPSNGTNGAATNGNNNINSPQLEEIFSNLERNMMTKLKGFVIDSMSGLETKLDTVIDIITPPPLPELCINKVSEEELVEKLQDVKGFGEKTLPKVVKPILKHRYFTSDNELIKAVPELWSKSRKAPSQKFNNLISTYKIDYSYPS